MHLTRKRTEIMVIALAALLLTAKRTEIKVIALAALLLTTCLCAGIFLLKSFATPVEQSVPPQKLIQVEGTDVTAVDITTGDDTFTNVSLTAQRGAPVYSLGDGVATLDEYGVSVRYNLKRPVSIRIGGGNGFTAAVTDGQQVKSGDLIGWVSQELLWMEQAQGSARLMLSCADGAENDPRQYIELSSKIETGVVAI